MNIKIKSPWNDPKYLMKRLEVDLKESRDYSPEEYEKDKKLGKINGEKNKDWTDEKK